MQPNFRFLRARLSRTPIEALTDEMAAPSDPDSPAAAAAKPRRVLPIHPALFAAFPLLALYANNIGQIPIKEIYRPLGISLIATLVVWAIFMLFTRHSKKSAIAASTVAVAFFSYGHILNLLPAGLQAFVGPVCAVALVVLLVLVIRIRRPLIDSTVVLNLASLVLPTPSSCSIGATIINPPEPAAPIGPRTTLRP